MGRRVAAAMALTVGVLAVRAGGAEAGGGRLSPVRDRYDPGEVATVVGYTAGPAPGTPFYAYLAGWYVGELAVEETGKAGSLQLRVSLTFEIPADLEPGEYEVVYCDDPCTGAPLGDLVASPLSVGLDPARRVVREWALDDPEIANLADDALLVGAGFATTAAELRRPAPVAVLVTEPPATPPPSVPVAPTTVPAPAPSPSDAMDWPLPTALVLAAAAGTWLGLAYRQRRSTPGRHPDASPERRPRTAATGHR